jgi:hypothetical protein
MTLFPYMCECANFLAWLIFMITIIVFFFQKKLIFILTLEFFTINGLTLCVNQASKVSIIISSPPPS